MKTECSKCVYLPSCSNLIEQSALRERGNVITLSGEVYNIEQDDYAKILERPAYLRVLSRGEDQCVYPVSMFTPLENGKSPWSLCTQPSSPLASSSR